MFKSLKKIFHQWGGTTAISFSLAHGFNDLPGGLLTAFLPMIRTGLGIDYLQSGLLVSAHHIASGIAQIPGGWISDRFSKRIAIAIGMGGIGLVTMAIGLCPSYYVLLFLFLTMGIFSGPYHPSAVSFLANNFEKERRGRVLATHSVGGSVGIALGPILGGVIAMLLGWQFIFIILSIPTLIAVFVVLVKFKKYEQQSLDQIQIETLSDSKLVAKKKVGLSSLGQVLKPIAIMTSLVIIIQLVDGSAMAFFSLYLVDKHHIDAAHAAMWLGSIRMGAIAASPIGGWLSDRWGRKNAIFLALVTSGPTLYLLTELPFTALFVVVFILWGLILQMRQSTVQPFLMDATPPELRGTVMGLYFGLAMEAGSLIQPIAAHYMDVLGIVEVFHIIARVSIGMSALAFLFAILPKIMSPGVKNPE